jgi:hypothetical protein
MASDADLFGWKSGMERSPNGLYVGLIVAPSGDPTITGNWSYPRYACHLLSRGADGGVEITLPALVFEAER